ncbi:restriction endonuclease subunit S [Limosilactobacillus reuteri]|uniref:restriction endonuclease subunit S n=1 Tax=Limosilactobacillus reuteri TaxID=1598 RepID=UPI00177B6431|nr:restriction endonuclease subunit S [Limosilactobacillus reuteri]
MHKTVKLDDIFNVTSTKSIDAGSLQFFETGINFIGRTNTNNGIQGKIKLQSFPPNDPNTITVTVIGNYKYVKFQSEPYYCSQNVNKLTLKPKFNKPLNYNIAAYFMTYVRKFVELYNGQQSGYKLSELASIKITVPVNKQNKIDFDFIESKMENYKQYEMKALDHYLSDFELKNSKFNNRKVKYKSFKLGHSYIKRGREILVDDDGLFDIIPTKKKINANIVSFNGKYPYVARGDSNNGIRGLIDYSEEFLNSANTISFGQDTATMYYQPNPYFTGDKIQIFKLNEKYGKLDEKLALYLISTIKKVLSYYTWGQQSFSLENISKIKVKLPVNSSEDLDIEYMKDHITSIEKQIVKSVVKYEKRITANTKEIAK